MTRSATLPEVSRAEGAAAPAGALGLRRAALLGATGYVGQEFLRLARAHSRIEIVALGVREGDGRTAPERFTSLDPAFSPAVCGMSELEGLVASGACDLVVACLPHGTWKEIQRRHPGLAAAPQTVDLSSDHRDGHGGFAYGLPEAFRTEIARSQRVANPGCYATAAALALIPAAEAGWLRGPVAVSALSGVSGAGRVPQLRTSFVEAEGGAWAYRAGTEHAHVAEIERTLARVSGVSPPIGFVPQVVPMARGILLTAFAPLKDSIAPAMARERYASRYVNEPFIRLLEDGRWPETRAVRGSNRCDLALTTLHDGRTLLVTAALDNLVKGAAGQAIQNLNLMNGWPETTGLAVDGAPW